MDFPVEQVLGQIRQALADNQPVVLTAPPGSGKTTVVPPALLDEPWLQGKKIVMLEPRRLAASRSAEYIARRLGETPGGKVGYQVRLERKIGPDTRLEIITEGLDNNQALKAAKEKADSANAALKDAEAALEQVRDEMNAKQDALRAAGLFWASEAAVPAQPDSVCAAADASPCPAGAVTGRIVCREYRYGRCVPDHFRG